MESNNTLINLTNIESMLFNLSYGLADHPEHFQRGLSNFAYLMLCCKPNCYEELGNLNRSTFIENYATKPIKEWFEGWSKDFISYVNQTSFSHLVEPIFDREENDLSEEIKFMMSSFLKGKRKYEEALPNTFLEFQEGSLYKKMTNLFHEGDLYVRIRKFLIEHPLLSKEELEETKNQVILEVGGDLTVSPEAVSYCLDVLETAYELIPFGAMQCPGCQYCSNATWAVTKNQKSATLNVCDKRRCLYRQADQQEEKESFKPLPKDTMRLILSAQKFICIPGKSEIDLYNSLKNDLDAGNLKAVTLWPEQDKMDLQIIFLNDESWMIDIKDWFNPKDLNREIRNDWQQMDSLMNQHQGVFYVYPDYLKKKNPNYHILASKEIADHVFSLNQIKKKIQEKIHASK